MTFMSPSDKEVDLWLAVYKSAIEGLHIADKHGVKLGSMIGSEARERADQAVKDFRRSLNSP